MGKKSKNKKNNISILALVALLLGASLLNANISIANPLSVPYIHQLCDTSDDFNGCWACGGTSAVMILAYYEKLGPWPFSPSYCNPQPRTSSYGQYVSLVYSYDGYTFNTMTYEPAVGTCDSPTLIPGDPAYGAYGYIHYDDGYAKAERARDYLSLHDLDSEILYYPTESEVKAEIDAGRPVWASTKLWPAGHIVVVKGYTYEGFSNLGSSCANGCYVVNDPWPYRTSWTEREGENYKYTWAEMQTGSKWIVTASLPASTPQDKSLIRAQGGIEVYWSQNGVRYHVLSEDVAQSMTDAGLPGWTWPTVNEFPQSTIDQYPEGSKFIASNSDSDGLLIRQSGTSPVYVMADGKRRWITSQEALKWKGTDWNPDVIEVTSSIISTYVPVQGDDIYAIGEGEANQTIKDDFIDAYTRNENDPYCQSPSSWKGWPGSFSSCLGFPTTPVGDAYASGCSGITGKYQKFDEYGGINWTSDYGAFEFHGAIGKKYEELGYSSSQLGFPTSDEYQWGSYRRSNLECDCYIYWIPSSDETYVVCPPSLSYITISGPTEVDESSGAQYACTAYYSDGSSSDVTSSTSWSEDSPWAIISSSGYLTSSVSSDQSCRITATYGGKSDTHDVTIKDSPPTLSYITISGPTEVDESSGAQYACTAYYSDGSSSDVTSSTSWSEDSSYATINSSGYLSSSSVSSDQSCRITATYGGKSDTHDITIKDIPPPLSYIEISGPTQVDENSNAQYTCTAYYNDGSSKDVTSSATWSVDSPYANINSGGYFTTKWVPSDQSCRITVSYEGESYHHNILLKSISAKIMGTVKRMSDGLPISGVKVDAYSIDDASGRMQFIAVAEQTASDGAYIVGGLLPGEYILRAYPPYGYEQIYYAHTMAPEDAERISIIGTEAISGKDFVLGPGGAIAGYVYEFDGITPIKGANVHASIAGTGRGGFGDCTDSEGYFDIRIGYGDYKVLSDDFSGCDTHGLHMREYYYEKSTWESADLVTVDSGNNPSLTFTLDEGGIVKGTIYEADGTTPVTGMQLLVYAYMGDDSCGEKQFMNNVWSNSSDGTYTIMGLPPGTYYLQTHNRSQSNYVNEWWASAGSTYDCGGAEAIVINAPGEVITGKDFQLDLGGSISGHIYDQLGSPISGAHVDISTRDPATGSIEHITASQPTGIDGSYFVLGLPPGTYILRAYPPAGYEQIYYPHTIDPQQAELMTISGTEDITGKDFNLGEGGVITGHVYESDGVTPISGANVHAMFFDSEDGGFGDCTNQNGSFEIRVGYGSYRVMADDFSGCDRQGLHLREYYNQKSTWDSADSVTVDFSNNPNLIFTLDKVGEEGDLNADRVVDLTDAVLALQVLAGMTPAGIRPDYASSGADVNGDGKIGVEEVIYILQKVSGLR